jgi:chromosome segregation ATPase
MTKKPNYQAIEVALSNEINRFDALIEARDALRNIASLEQAAQETQARIDKLRDDEKAVRAKIAGLDAEFAKKRAEAQAEADQVRADAQKVVDDADAAAARILATAQARANKLVGDAQAKLTGLEDRAKKLSDAIRGVA